MTVQRWYTEGMMKESTSFDLQSDLGADNIFQGDFYGNWKRPGNHHVWA
jgi:hypothetical protein